MKILLQHVLTSYYLCDWGGWSEDSQQALDFGHTQKAIDYTREHRLSGVQLAVRFADSDGDALFSIPSSGLAADAIQLTDFR